MRIVSGSLKGRRISAPDSLSVRPTSDMAKESLFNILNNLLDFQGEKVLDLFAGIGGISLEFISRGCDYVHSVEMNRENLSFIIETTKKLGIDNLRAIRQDAFSYPKSCKEKYSIIFADPPYQAPEIAQLPEIIFSSDILEEDGIFILEHSKANNFKNHSHFRDERVYGKVHFSFFDAQAKI